MNKLFAEFPGTTSAQWREKIIKDLKGIDFNQLEWDSPNGKIEPFYTSEDSKGSAAPLFSHCDWDICENIHVADERSANARALKALEGGASGLSFYISKRINTAELIRGISLEHIYSQFFISNDALHVLGDLKDHYGKINQHDHKIKCFVNIDPLALYAQNGGWYDSVEKDLSLLERLIHIPVNCVPYHEAGANAINELAIALAHANEYFSYLSEKNLLKEKTLHFSFSSGADFFAEIAKFRAFRKLIAFLQKQYETDFPIHIHAQTALINKSAMDAYNNMLRTTTEGMSAVIGGCDSLCVLRYDESLDDVTDFSSRIARNQQHIYKEESYLNKVADIGSGSYYVEALTEMLCEKGWEQFKAIEARGGFIEGITSNYIQSIIEKDAQIKLDQLKENKTVLVGVNKYENAKEQVKLRAGKEDELDVKSSIKPIKPIRLSESFELKKLKAVNS